MAYIYELKAYVAPNNPNATHYSNWDENYTGNFEGDPPLAHAGENGSNWDINLIAAAGNNAYPNPEGAPLIIDDGLTLGNDSGGAASDAGDGEIDAGETFTFTADFDGNGTVLYTGTADYFYTPNANPDTSVLVFEVEIGGILRKFAYNLGNGTDGEADLNRIEGGHITDGMTNQGNVFASYGDRAQDCFVRGTLIETPTGEMLVENINIGDKIKTLSSGTQVVRWIGCSKTRSKPSIAPIRFKAGALGENVPNKDLLISPAHRLVISGWRAELLFGETEYLVPAKNLVNDDTITVAHDLKQIEYYHILFDKHEIVMSNGTPSESYHPNQTSVGNMDEAARTELLDIFPELGTADQSGYSEAVRPMLTDAEAKLL